MPPPDAEPPARYLQIADELRRRIDAGEIGVAAPLPSDAEIGKEFGVARGTVRQAIQVLREQGRVHTLRRRGTYVRPQIPTVRRGMSRYRADLQSTRERPQTSFTVERGIDWANHKPDLQLAEVTAPADVAGLFGVPEDTALLRRDLVFRVRGWPTQMSTSYYLLDMVAGTPVATPESEPAPGGAIGHLASLGVEVTRIVETVVSRMPDRREAAILRLSAGTVIKITRRMFAGEQVVEVARDIVIPGDLVELEYEIEL